MTAETLPNAADIEFRIGVSRDRNFVVGYLRAAARPGEDWNRGGDLGDGRLDDDETIDRVIGRIRDELIAMRAERRPEAA